MNRAHHSTDPGASLGVSAATTSFSLVLGGASVGFPLLRRMKTPKAIAATISRIPMPTAMPAPITTLWSPVVGAHVEDVRESLGVGFGVAWEAVGMGGIASTLVMDRVMLPKMIVEIVVELLFLIIILTSMIAT